MTNPALGITAGSAVLGSGILGGGGGGNQTSTVETNTEPWIGQQPYLSSGFQEAARLYGSGGPQYYPWQTTTPFSPQSQTAMELQQGRALAGSPVTDAARNQLTGTLQGDYLNPQSNPYLSQYAEAAMEPVARQYKEAVFPGIEGQFAGAGRYGGGLRETSLDRARDTLGHTLGNISTNIFAPAYNQERQRQMQGMSLAPMTAQQDYADIAQLGNVGQRVEGQAGALRQDEMNRWNFMQNAPYQNLNQYANTIQGNYGAQSQQTTPEYGGSTLQNILGAGLLGYGAYQNRAQPAQAAAGGSIWNTPSTSDWWNQQTAGLNF